MGKLILVFRSIGNLLMMLFTVSVFRFTKGNYGLKYAQQTFFIFGGKPGTLASKILRKKANFKLNHVEHNLSSGIDYKTIDSELKQQGFVVEKKFLSQESVKSIKDFSLKNLGAYRETDKGEGALANILFDPSDPKAIRYDYSPSTVLACTDVQKVLSDKRVLAIAQNYLGGEPILDFVAMWWHTKSLSPDSNAAQLFHFDMDRLRWIKFFFYVTDVGIDNGPHVYVPSSHHDNALPFSLRKRGYVRHSDKDVARHFPESNWKFFTGEAGTMIAEDTRGLHKGAHVLRGNRLLFQFQFTSALYGKSEEPDNMALNSSVLTKELRHAIGEFPHIFQKIKIFN